MSRALGLADQPRWLPTPHFGFLTVVADGAGVHDRALFLAACRADAEGHGGIVSVNRVRALLTNAEIQIAPRRFSALWLVNTGKNRAMMRTDDWEICAGSTSRNDGRPLRLRRWVAFSTPRGGGSAEQLPAVA